MRLRAHLSCLSGLLGCALLAALHAGCSREGAVGAQGGEMPPVAVRAVAATAMDVPLDVAAVGTVEAPASVEVKSRVTGPVRRALFEEGQDVAANAPLFEIDPEPLQAQLQSLEAGLARDVALERQAQATLLRDQAQLKNARSQAERATQLAREGLASREQTDQVLSAAEAAEAGLEANRAALESAQAAVKAGRARLEEVRLQLTYTTIRAPMAGRVGAIAVRPGNVVKENETTLATILQMAPISVAFPVPERVLADVRQHSRGRRLPVEATPAGGVPALGALRFIDNTVDAATGMIRLKAEFDNRGRALWPGQFVNVRIRLDTQEGRITVPTRAVQTGPQGAYVWVVGADSRAAMRPVAVARTWAEQSVVDSGLRAGERVVSEGQMRLAPGAPVRLLPAGR